MNRIEILLGKMHAEKINSVLIFDPKAICYFTGDLYSPGERLTVLAVRDDGDVTLFINQLFPLKSDRFKTYIFSDTDDPTDELAKYCVGTCAVDKDFPARFLLPLMKKTDAQFIVGSVIDKVKAVKSEEERAKMRVSSLKNDEVMAEVRKIIKVGKSEKEIATEIVGAFKRITGQTSFTPIVAFMDHAADPHAEPGDRILKEGECVVVDMGCVLDGYCSDMTRTFFVGENTEKEIYDTVLKANLAGIAAVKPGIPFKEIDKAARDVIEKAGYGKYFIHRLGHGIGMDVHEPFDVSATDEVIVEEGMCFSIEPGIYIPGRVGIRIEDLVCVSKDGAEVLNHYPKDDEVIPL